LPPEEGKDASGDDDDRGGGGAAFVELVAFDALTAWHGGLYRAFQALCDPVTVVFEMGTVEDSPARIVPVPTVVAGLLGVSVRQICCGGQHAAVLSAEGQVYTWGRGGFGRLGHGSTESAASPVAVAGRLQGEVCVQVACGFAYTAAVTRAGALYTWGAGENGRLGLGDADDRHGKARRGLSFSGLPCSKRLRTGCCVLQNRTVCIVFYYYFFNRLDFCFRAPIALFWLRWRPLPTAPALVEELLHTPVKECFAGSVHTCVLTRLGQVYSFGKFEYTGHGRMGQDVLVNF
jgi:hypothetical protein